MKMALIQYLWQNYNDKKFNYQKNLSCQIPRTLFIPKLLQNLLFYISKSIDLTKS